MPKNDYKIFYKDKFLCLKSETEQFGTDEILADGMIINIILNFHFINKQGLYTGIRDNASTFTFEKTKGDTK